MTVTGRFVALLALGIVPIVLLGDTIGQAMTVQIGRASCRERVF